VGKIIPSTPKTGAAMGAVRFVLAMTCCLLGIVMPGGPITAQSGTPLHIATTENDPGSEPLYAVDMGFFARAGIAPSLLSIPNSSAVIEALVSGTIDVGYVNITNLEVAYKKGISLVAIAPAAVLSAAADKQNVYLMVRNGGQISKPQDFAGKTVATPGLKSLVEIGASAWIDKNGGDSTKIHYLELPFPAIAAALKQGRVDAAVLLEPFASDAKSVAHTIGPNPMGAIAPIALAGAFITTKTWAAAHPDLVRAFAEAISETANWANANQDKSLVILCKYTATDIQTLKGTHRAFFGDRLRPELIQPTINVIARYNLIDASYDARELIYQVPELKGGNLK
jgi:NitT/TauT family transport system substrate-binding protein